MVEKEKDITEKLRSIYAIGDQTGWRMPCLLEAADEIERLRAALEASIAANELILAQLRGGQDLTEDQVSKAMNAALAKARAILKKNGGE